MALGQLSQFRGELFEGRFGVGGKRLAQDFAMLGLGRAAVARGAAFQAGDQVILEIADEQVSSHDTSLATNDSTDIKRRQDDHWADVL